MTRLPVVRVANDNGGRQTCEPLRANLSVASCAGRWNAAQLDLSGQYRLCRDCEFGAANSMRVSA